MARNAEFDAIPEVGMARIMLDLEKLPVCGTVLQVGAHPDDEDNALLAYLSKGLHLDTYYLVANWGEGGQNEIGPELYEALGVLRSQELAAARGIDGAVQLYLGTYDFGFSKTGAEALEKWGHQECLRRMVRFFRLYRPEIVITHHDTVCGHGQHQAIGTLVLEAYEAAANPARFPQQIAGEGLQPWQVEKLYVTDKNPTVRVNVGEFNPILGRSYHEIGALARSMHKCQGMVGTGLKGDQMRGYKLVRSARSGIPAQEESLTDGLDLTLGRLMDGLDGVPPLRSVFQGKVAQLGETIARVLSDIDPTEPGLVLAEVVKGLELVRDLKAMVATFQLRQECRYLIERRLLDKERDFEQAVRDLCATSLDVTAEDSDVVPGRSTVVTVAFWNRGRVPVEHIHLSLDLPADWTLSGDSEVKESLGFNQRAEARFVVTVPADATFTGAFDPAPVTATASWRVHGTPLTTSGVSDLRVIPAVGVGICPRKLMLPVSGAATTRTVSVKLRNSVKGAARGAVRLRLPAGWSASGDPTFAMNGQGEETSVALTISIPAGQQVGRYRLAAAAEYDGGRSEASYQVISYPHIDTKYLYRTAEAALGVIDVAVAPGLKVGYISSGFDNVPEYLREMGVDVEPLGQDDLSLGDLSRYDTIVTGIRAYHRRPDLVASNPRLLDYVRGGGNLIVQYNKGCEWKPEYAPYPIHVSPSRVTVEEAPVTVLHPEHVLLNAPNRITAEDWRGWVHERGLYFPAEWAAEYTALVAMNDPGEPVQKGSWLVARHGAGTYIYSALVWYRQLDGLVAGGYRIFANMISLPKVQ